MNRRFGACLFLAIASGSAWASTRTARVASQEPCVQEHTAWVSQALIKMETIKTGMTRQNLLKVFTTEGGIYTGLQRTYASRDCPYFKVDVSFDAVGRPNHDKDGRVTLVEDDRDKIVSISRPYLQFTIAD
jgi:hypothetical protein